MGTACVTEDLKTLLVRPAVASAFREQRGADGQVAPLDPVSSAFQHLTDQVADSLLYAIVDYSISETVKELFLDAHYGGLDGADGRSGLPGYGRS